MLTPEDLPAQGSTDFNNPQEAPVVQALGSSNQYDRPWRGNAQGQPDYDYLDEVQESNERSAGADRDRGVRGPVLTVTVSASQTTVPVGRSVTFNATVTGEGDSALSYSWNFDGGAPNSAAPSPQVTFGTAGQYDVTVQVTDSAGDGGGAEIPITVGTPSPAGHRQSPANRVGDVEKVPSPERSAEEQRNPRRRQGRQVEHGQVDDGGHGQQLERGTNTATTTSTTSTSTTSSTTPSSTHRHLGPHDYAEGQAPSCERTGSRAPAPRPPASGPLVSGLLVSDVTPLPPGASPLVHVVPAAVATAPPARQAIRASLAAGLRRRLRGPPAAGARSRARAARAPSRPTLARRQLRSWSSSPPCP